MSIHILSHRFLSRVRQHDTHVGFICKGIDIIHQQHFHNFSGSSLQAQAS